MWIMVGCQVGCRDEKHNDRYSSQQLPNADDLVWSFWFLSPPLNPACLLVGFKDYVYKSIEHGVKLLIWCWNQHSFITSVPTPSGIPAIWIRSCLIMDLNNNDTWFGYATGNIKKENLVSRKTNTKHLRTFKWRWPFKCHLHYHVS